MGSHREKWRRAGRRARRRPRDLDVSLEEGVVHDAQRRAEQRVQLLGELVRYALICGLLLVFATPIGVVVAFWWGIGLAKRYYALEAVPRLRRRWTAEELRRRGVDPASEGVGEPALRLASVRIAKLVDEVVAERAQRLAFEGVALQRESDGEGALRADPVELRRALGLLVDCALDHGRLGLEVAAGENLAGTEVWVRVRAHGGARGGSEPRPASGRLELDSAREIAAAHGGALEVHAGANGEVELVLTLPQEAPRTA